MEKLNKYNQLIISALEAYIASDSMNPDQELYLVVDPVKMHYLLYHNRWRGLWLFGAYSA